MHKRIRMRRRDVTRPEKPTVVPQVVRLERIIERDAPTDLTPLEKQLRTNSKDIQDLRQLIVSKKTSDPANYRFHVHRKAISIDGTSIPLIDYVDGIVIGEHTTLLDLPQH